jgi:hypothetical protein
MSQDHSQSHIAQHLRIQVVYKPRAFSYDQDWLDAFKGAEFVKEPTKLDADLVVILHSVSAQWEGYQPWLVNACKERKGKLVIFHANEFKAVKEREQAAKEMGADFIATQLPDGRLYSMPTISMPHALNPAAFNDLKLQRTISVGFRGALYKPGINDSRNKVIRAFRGVPNSDIALDHKQLMTRGGWCRFLNLCKATPGAEAGDAASRIITPRHLEAVGTRTLQVLLHGYYCGVLDQNHYVPFTTIERAMDVINDDRIRNEITERALTHVLENHTHKHRIAHLKATVWPNSTYKSS